MTLEALLDSADWYEGLTLAERAALPEAPNQDFDRREGEKRAHYWRQQTGLVDEDLFASRLALNDLSADRFLRLLQESPESLRARSPGPPAWLRAVQQAYSQPADTLPPMPLKGLGNVAHAGFLEWVSPLTRVAFGHLRNDLRELFADRRQRLCELDTAAELAVGQLPAQLLFMVSHALTLELRILSLEEELPGDTPEARFESFVESLADRPTALSLLARYPVLARSIVLRLKQWRKNHLQLFQRLMTDWLDLKRRFSPEQDPGELVEIAADLSDRHHGGRTVAVLRFASGLRLVYKPRPLASERRFQHLLRWLNERGQQPMLPILEVLDRGAYGWTEFVDSHPCASRREVDLFYQRQGAYLALLYGIEASDFHYENVIARGEFPLLVDLETLLQPEARATDDSVDFVSQTVLRTHLLPGTTAEHLQGLEVGGLSSTRGQTVSLHGIDHIGTDRMQLALRPAEVPSQDNLPTLKQIETEPWEFRRTILGGFESTYRLLVRWREDLLVPEGPLAGLADCTMRVLVRPTGLYSRLLIMACHPDVAQSGLARDRLYDKLWLGARQSARVARRIGAELTDLTHQDIPHFVAHPRSCDLHTSSGECLAGHFAASGWDKVTQRLRALDDDDLQRQKYLIRESLRSARPLGGGSDDELNPLPAASQPADGERFLAAALAIGERLEQLAVHRGDQSSWFHVAVSAEHRAFRPVNPDLYDGLGGIAVFFAHLGERAAAVRFTALARRVLQAARRNLECFPESLPGIGAFSGRGGWIYTLAHLGLLWREPSLLAEAERQASAIEERLAADTAFDLIGGAAGAIAALLVLHQQRPSEAILQTAVACGEHLLHHRRVEERGLGWPSPMGEDLPPLTGLGHGTAGFAWVLASLARVSGQQRFAEAVQQTLAYERSWFSAKKNNWPDLRQTIDREGEPSFFHGWCHGAPGIGLARLAMLDSWDDLAMEPEIRAALISTRQQGFGRSHCLCHGDLGNLELLRLAGERLGNANLGAEAEGLAAAVLHHVERDGPRCGVGADGEPPGLMTGLAGIGYGLLRAAAPHRVPSVLLLEVPG
ncbi:MAG: type 2 lanthipeptide synthetase LanM family protein [Acidobacteriota bacterium]